MYRGPVLAAFVVLACSCGDATGPSGPGEGSVIAWFNGLGASVDLFFTGDGTLVGQAFVTGEAPNDIVPLGGGIFAVVNSLSSTVAFFDSGQPGAMLGEAVLPAGCNPYQACEREGILLVTGLTSGSVYSVDPATLAVTEEFTGLPSPSGIAAADGLVFVGCANWPVAGSHGTIVIDPGSGETVDTIATPENTHTLRYFPQTGMVHAFSTTYTGDGAVTIIDPASLSITAVVPTGGTPGPSARSGGVFYSGDGWSSTGVFAYDETGDFETLEAGCGVTGVAALGDTLFLTSFDSDAVLVFDAGGWTPLDTLQAGDGPQGIALVE